MFLRWSIQEFSFSLFRIISILVNYSCRKTTLTTHRARSSIVGDLQQVFKSGLSFEFITVHSSPVTAFFSPIFITIFLHSLNQVNPCLLEGQLDQSIAFLISLCVFDQSCIYSISGFSFAFRFFSSCSPFRIRPLYCLSKIVVGIVIYSIIVIFVIIELGNRVSLLLCFIVSSSSLPFA